MKRNKNKYILLSLIGILFLMIVGYAGFSSNLNMAESSEVTNNWNISITDVKTKSGTATNNTEPSYESLTANFDVNFKSIGDYIEYDVTVTNNGNVEANLNDIVINNENNDVVNMTYSGVEAGDVLTPLESITFTVKLLYKGGNKTGTIDMSLDYGQEKEENEVITPTENLKVVYDYETNGGTGEITENYYNEGENIDLNITGKKEGYTFVGWSADKDSKEVLSELSMPNENITLYAIYKKDLDVIYKLGKDVYKIEKESDTCSIYNNETECTITLPSIDAGEYVVDGWYDLENNKYEALEKIVLTEKGEYEARVYDTTPAELEVTTSKTSRSITIVANATANIEIIKYEYSLDSGSTWEEGTNTYTFDNLEHNTKYDISTRVTTKGNVKTTKKVEVITNEIEMPTFTQISESEVLITYPEVCNGTYTCSYIKDDEEEVIVTESTTVIFGASGTLIATVTDGTNYITSSAYTVERTNLYVASAGSDETGYGTIEAPYATLNKAYDSASLMQDATIYVMDDVTATETTTLDENKTITLTSYSEDDSVNSIIRGSELTEYLVNQIVGTLNFENITIDGNNVSSTTTVFNISGVVNANSGATFTNANTISDGGIFYVLETGTINLNGAEITNNKASRGPAIFNLGTINMESGLISGNEASSSAGGIWNRGLFNMNGGEISGNIAASGGGGVNNTYDEVLGAGTMLMRGGKIVNNTCQGCSGGGIYNNSNTVATEITTLKIIDGEIKNNKAIDAGGAGVYNKGSFILDGGVISNNEATNGGGGVQNARTMIINGGTISENTAGYGGGINNTYSSDMAGALTINNGLIDNNTSSGSGGGIRVNNNEIEMGSATLAASLTLINGNITNNTGSTGGGIYVASSTGVQSIVEIQGGTIYKNKTTTYSGGGIYAYGILKISDGNISSNTAYTIGGGLMCKKSCTMTGSIFSDNTAEDGGAIYCEGQCNISEGTIGNNTASESGGGIIFSKGEHILSGGIISNNSAVKYAGGVGIANSGLLTMTGGTIEENTTDSGGGVTIFTDGTFILSGGVIKNNIATTAYGGINPSGGTYTYESGVVCGNTPSNSYETHTTCP